ncbi:porin [Idiomarina aminovorans]|uniref:porin n=1 Tax=Idiomarina aminovorans TaxID=2914829 RepID=UPI0020051B37|nr:porin [Idiomarina sp. ATCH4]MCK7458420.1 porin [Idiomarina sp. ATCH4]
MKKAVLATLIGAALFSGATLAADQGSNFDRLEARYIDYSDIDGFGLSGRVMLNESIYFTGDYAHTSESSLDVDEILAGIGYKHEFSEKFTGFADVNLSYMDYDAQLASDDDTGYAVQVGGVYRLNPAVEFSGLVRHIDNDIFVDSEQEYELAARWYINNEFSLSATYVDGFDSDWRDGYFIGAAWHF